MAKLPICSIFLCFITLVSVNATTVYRYQDEKGRWHFSDKKPKEKHQQIQLTPKKENDGVPQLFWSEDDQGRELYSHNPWYAPVQFELMDSGNILSSWVVEPQGRLPVRVKDNIVTHWKDSFEYKYRLGRPISAGDSQALRPPVPGVGKYRITQSFNGRFSHSKEPNKHAIDIAMKISDQVYAARDGVVVLVKDDYHMGGTDQFFLDKANFITVLHSDDTYAVYAHILLGSALVKPGDKVTAGQALANTGTSGYSTGPHLHFVLRMNNGKKIQSLPFTLKLGNKKIPPKEGMWLNLN